jgi:hypothetical protein
LSPKHVKLIRGALTGHAGSKKETHLDRVVRSRCSSDLTGALVKGKVILQPMRPEPSMVLRPSNGFT